MQRGIVVGCPGAGKSTFARRLHAHTGLLLHDLDLLCHRPNRTKVFRQEFDAALSGRPCHRMLDPLATTSARWRCAYRPATRYSSLAIRCSSVWPVHRNTLAKSEKICPESRQAAPRSSNSGSKIPKN